MCLCVHRYQSFCWPASFSVCVRDECVCMRAYPHGPVFVCALERASWSRTVSLTLKFG